MFDRRFVSYPTGFLFIAVGLNIFGACSGGDEFGSGTGGSSSTDGSKPDAKDAATTDSGTDVSNMPDVRNDSTTLGKENGSPCNAGVECASTHCIDAVCCNADCSSPCQSCNVPNQAGTCTPYTAGLDPEGDCAKPDSGLGTCEQVCDGQGACASCGLFKCGLLNMCMNSCGADIDCKREAWCNSYVCEAKKANGGACQNPNECTSNVC